MEVRLHIFGASGSGTTTLARTLAELDHRLQQAEGLARWTGGFGRRRDAPAAAPG